MEYQIYLCELGFFIGWADHEGQLHQTSGFTLILGDAQKALTDGPDSSGRFGKHLNSFDGKAPWASDSEAPGCSYIHL